MLAMNKPKDVQTPMLPSLSVYRHDVHLTAFQMKGTTIVCTINRDWVDLIPYWEGLR